jgi:hypothetical protein
MAWAGVPFGHYARLILLYLQAEALRIEHRDIELGRCLRIWLQGLACRSAVTFSGNIRSGGGLADRTFGLSRLLTRAAIARDPEKQSRTIQAPLRKGAKHADRSRTIEGT